MGKIKIHPSGDANRRIVIPHTRRNSTPLQTRLFSRSVKSQTQSSVVCTNTHTVHTCDRRYPVWPLGPLNAAMSCPRAGIYPTSLATLRHAATSNLVDRSGELRPDERSQHSYGGQADHDDGHSSLQTRPNNRIRVVPTRIRRPSELHNRAKPSTAGYDNEDAEREHNDHLNPGPPPHLQPRQYR